MTRRDIYEAGRADERSEIVAWLRSIAAAREGTAVPVREVVLIRQLADRADRGEHAEAVVLGAEVPG